MEYQPMADTGEVDEFTRAYLEAAEWAGLSEDDGEALELAVMPRWTEASLKEAQATCQDFTEAAGNLLDGLSDTQGGLDLWLTSQGHGVGFWDRGLGEVGDKLTELSRPYGGCYVYFDEATERLHLEP